MNDGAVREQTLDEWVEMLPKTHRARNDLQALRAQLAEVTHSRDEALALVERLREALGAWWDDNCRKLTPTGEGPTREWEALCDVMEHEPFPAQALADLRARIRAEAMEGAAKIADERMRLLLEAAVIHRRAGRMGLASANSDNAEQIEIVSAAIRAAKEQR